MAAAVEHLPSATPPRRQLAAALVLALLVGLASYASLRLTRMGGGVATVWIANGLLTGALLLAPRALWPWLFAAAGVAQAVARLANGDPVAPALGIVLVNLLECWIVVGWVRRRVSDLRRTPRLGPVARDALGSTVVACLVSATLATPLLVWQTPGVAAFDAFSIWGTAHLLGMVIVATLVVCAFQPHVQLQGRAGTRLDYFTCVALLALTCALVFAQSRLPLLFLPYLPLLLLAYRHSLSGMVVGVLLLSVASALSAIARTGPFVLLDVPLLLVEVLFWQFYVACGCLLAYTTAVALVERQQLEKRAQRSEARLLAITENLPALVARFDRDGRYLYANARSRALLPGVPMIGRTLREVRGPERYAPLAPHVDAVLRGEPQEFDVTVDRGLEPMVLHVQFVPDVGPDGQVQGFYSLSFDVTEARAAREELERLARHDDLTGLSNRRSFDELLARAVNRASRKGAPLMLLALDIDRFKSINDTHGHAVGDAVLRVFAQRLRLAVFDVDQVARMGGDEFLVLVEYTPLASVGSHMAARICESMRTPMRIGELVLDVHCSIGIGVCDPATTGPELLARADAALYAAKGAGRNTWALRTA